MFEASKFDDVDPDETREWLESIDSVLQHARRRPRALPARATDRSHAPLRRVSAVQAEHRLRQHDLAGPGEGISRATARSSAASRRTSAGTRWRWWCRRTGRAPSTAATSRATPRRRRSTKSASTISGARPARITGRHGLHPGPLVARHLRARLPRRPADRGAAAALPPGGRRPRACRRIRIRG